MKREVCYNKSEVKTELTSRKEVNIVEWITPDFEEYELEAEVTAYMDHW